MNSKFNWEGFNWQAYVAACVEPSSIKFVGDDFDWDAFAAGGSK